jgi:hypothetical protein
MQPGLVGWRHVPSIVPSPRPWLLLLQVFGDAPTLAGYPPWAVRASEIFHMGPLEQLQPADLQHAMHRYLGTMQRFGA